MVRLAANGNSLLGFSDSWVHRLGPDYAVVNRAINGTSITDKVTKPWAEAFAWRAWNSWENQGQYDASAVDGIIHMGWDIIDSANGTLYSTFEVYDLLIARYIANGTFPIIFVRGPGFNPAAAEYDQAKQDLFNQWWDDMEARWTQAQVHVLNVASAIYDPSHWLDCVHYTSAGHQSIADCIKPQLDAIFGLGSA